VLRSHRLAVLAASIAVIGFGVSPAPVSASPQNRVADAATALGLQSFGVYSRPTSGEVVFAGKRLSAAAHARLASAAAPADLSVGRDLDPELMTAGFGILLGRFVCTSGFDVVDPTGADYALMAGHCGPVGTAVVSTAGAPLGTIIASTFDATTTFSDSAVFGPVPADYATATTFTAAHAQQPVIGALTNRGIRLGAKICFSGSVTAYQTCGPVIRQNVALNIGGRLLKGNACVAAKIRHGDSGGPAYERRAAGALAAGLISSSARFRIDGRNVPIACFTKIANALRVNNVKLLVH
jgi:hypothetical protein